MLEHHLYSRDTRENSASSLSSISTATPGSHPATGMLLSVPEVMAAIKCRSRTTLYRLERESGFPRRVHLGERSVAFVADEVGTWIQNRIKARDTAPAPPVIEANPASDTGDQPIVKRGRGRPRKIVVTAMEG